MYRHTEVLQNTSTHAHILFIIAFCDKFVNVLSDIHLKDEATVWLFVTSCGIS